MKLTNLQSTYTYTEEENEAYKTFMSTYIWGLVSWLSVIYANYSRSVTITTTSCTERIKGTSNK